jgi:hypothetical protein
LFGKFFPHRAGGGGLGELFITLRFILPQRRRLMVNQTSPAGRLRIASRGQRGAMNAVLIGSTLVCRPGRKH